MQICMWCMTVRVRVWRVTEADVDDVDGRVPETDVPDTAERSRAHVESPACLGMHSIHLLLAAITLGVRGAFFDWQAMYPHPYPSPHIPPSILPLTLPARVPAAVPSGAADTWL